MRRTADGPNPPGDLSLASKRRRTAGDPAGDERLQEPGGRDELDDLRRQNRELEQALRESEEHLKLTLEAARAGIWISGRDGSWKATPQLNTLFGCPEDIVFHSEHELRGFIHPDDLQPLSDAWMGSLRSGFPFEFEYRIIWKDGSLHWLAAKGKVCQEDGTPRFIGITSDITERKRMEEAQRERIETERALINFPTDVALVLDQEGTILNINDNYARILGRPADDLLGQSIWGLMPAGVAASRRIRFDQAIRTGTTVRFEEHREGKWYDSLVHPILSPDGSVTRIAITSRDITDRKLANDQLKRYADHLKRSNEDLELFVSIATHDLQEPVRGIVIFSQLLLSQVRDGKSPDAEKYLRVIESAGLQMSAIVNDLREYSRIRTHAKPMEPVDAGASLSTALDNLHLLIGEHGATVVSDRLPEVHGDATQVTQVFQNLIDNAIKFGREGIAPAIEIAAAPVEGMWQFSVRDNGIGIPPQYFTKIFILFERLHDRDVYQGTGLGLALCKRIVEQHGGEMWVESEVGVGSTFYFTLPAVPSP